MRALWWIILLISTWAVLYFSTDKRRFRAFWTGGVWSVGLAMMGEALIRARIDYFVPERLLIPFLGTEFVNFLGPRFVEGVLFMQSLRPTRQLLKALGWVAAIVLSEISLAFNGYITLSWNGVGLALAVHTLRFLSLLGIYHALDYPLLQRRMMRQSTRRTLLRLILGASRRFWPISWPFFGLGTALVLKLTGALDRRLSRSRT